MHHQPVAIDVEFVAFGLAAKNRVVVKDQACASGLSPREEKCGGESTDAASHDNAIEEITGTDDLLWAPVKPVIANGMASRHHIIGVAIGLGVIADAAKTFPVRFGQEI